MIFHLNNQLLIADHWPTLRELIKGHFPNEAAECPSYTNNILTHALLNVDDFQLLLYYNDDDLNVPVSFFILDMVYDTLIDKKICSVPAWIAIKQMTVPQAKEMAQQLAAWIKGWGCVTMRAQSLEERVARKEAAAMARLGLIKNVKLTYSWYGDL